MKRLNTTIALLTLFTIFMAPLVPANVRAASQDVIITELQTSGSTASEEFIELYNTTDHYIDLSDSTHQGKKSWKLQFFSSTKVTATGINWDPKTSGLTTLSLTHSDGSPVTIAPYQYFLISSGTYRPGGVEPDLTYSSGRMSDSGGGIQLVDDGQTQDQVLTAHDQVGWFQPSAAMPLPSGLYLSPSPGSSLQRAPNTQGVYEQIGDLPLYITSTSITPKTVWAVPQEMTIPSVLEVESVAVANDVEVLESNNQLEEAMSSQSSSSSASTATMITLQPVQITELLPNPATPQTDDHDEFIELFNPNNQAIDLTSYSLQTGLKYSYSYTFQGTTIGPEAYLLLTRGNSRLTLANSGGQARLMDGTAQVISQTAAYGEAKEGEAWALINGNWQWTTTPTPASTNNLSPPLATVPKASKATKPTTKAATKPKSTAKTTTTKAPKASSSTKTSKPKISAADQEMADEANRPTPLHRAVLVGAAAIAVLYGAYEYRTDMGNKLYQFRRHREARRVNRQAAEGAGSN